MNETRRTGDVITEYRPSFLIDMNIYTNDWYINPVVLRDYEHGTEVFYKKDLPDELREWIENIEKELRKVIDSVDDMPIIKSEVKL